MIKLLIAINKWSDTKTWHSWVIHGLGAIPIALVFGLNATSTFFLLRELEQLAHEKMNGVTPDYQDHLGDWIIPSLVAGLIGVLVNG